VLKKVIKYTDYDGNERTETFFFNLSKAELMEMEFGVDGRLTQYFEKIVEAQDNVKVMAMFKEIILKAYGEKSPDGKRFIKSKELSEAFSQTEAYTELMMEIMSGDGAATAFAVGILPAELQKPAQDRAEK